MNTDGPGRADCLRVSCMSQTVEGPNWAAEKRPANRILSTSDRAVLAQRAAGEL